MAILKYFPLPAGTYWKSSPFGWRVHPVTGVRTLHRGCDYAAPSGTPIFASIDGFVTTGYEAGGAGNWTNISNNGVVVKCFHQSRYELRSGFVKAGQTIGYVGTTGASTGAHLHFELWINGGVVDPAQELDAAPLYDPNTNSSTAKPAEEEDEMASFIAWKKDTGAFEVSGMLKRALSPEDLAALRYLGVVDKGELPDNFWSLKTEIPRGKIAGEG